MCWRRIAVTALATNLVANLVKQAGVLPGSKDYLACAELVPLRVSLANLLESLP